MPMPESHPSLLKTAAHAAVLASACLMLAGCHEPVNSPRELADYSTNTLFSSFSGRSPKTLDPQASYSSDETLYTYSIYEPPYGYHYLKRPYELEGRAAAAVVVPKYVDRDGKVLPADADSSLIDKSIYRIPIKKGIRFAPHPCFAKDASGAYLYHHLDEKTASGIVNPLDLPEKGTRELVAEDFVYGIKRIASPRVVSPVLGVIGEHVPGLKALNAELTERDRRLRREAGDFAWLDLRKSRLEGVRALDAHTLEITIRGKYPQFANWLAMAFFAPIPWEADAFYANEALARNNVTLASWPVGTGPYMLVESRQNREHVMERNPNFRFEPYPCEGEPSDKAAGYLEDCGKPIPFIDRIVMTMEKEAVPTTVKVLQGYYDSPQITRLDVGQGYLVAMGDSPDKAKLYAEHKLQFPTAVEANIWYMGFNWLDPVVGGGSTPEQAERNRKLRQAISIAIDWEEQIAIFEKGQGRAAHGPLPPGLFGWRDDGPSAFNPYVYRKDENGRIVRRSIEDARALMREAGYPDGRDAVTGRPLVLNFDWQGSSPGSKSFLEWFARQFAKIGIQLEIRATDYNRFQDKMMKGAAQIYYWGWLADYPDAENFLFLLYGPNSKVGSASGGENASNYRSPEFDRLFDRMRYLADGPEKARAIDGMIEVVQRDAPWSFGYYPTSAAALQQWVGNAKPTATVRNNVQYMKIDAELRARKIREWSRPVVWPVVLALLAVIGLGLAARRQVMKRREARAVEALDSQCDEKKGGARC